MNKLSKGICWGLSFCIPFWLAWWYIYKNMDEMSKGIEKKPSYFILIFDDSDTEYSIPITPGAMYNIAHSDSVTTTTVIIPESGSEWEECEEGCE